MRRELAAEFIGTFTLVSAVCGAALFSAPSAGLMAVAFAVGDRRAADGFRGRANLGWTFQSGGDLRNGGGAALPNRPCAALHHHSAHWWSAGLFRLLSGLEGAPADGKWNTFTAASNLYGGAGFSLGSGIS